LVALPFVFFPENIDGVDDKSKAFSVAITSVTEDLPVEGGTLICQDAYITGGTTAWVRAGTPGKSGRIYTLGFSATDQKTGPTCTGTVPVCVQSLFRQGNCVSTGKPYDSTKCK
jgi:hypothetical protein